MSDADRVDWSKPIVAPYFGTFEGRVIYDLPEVRREQLRRAGLLIAATGGKPLTRGNAEVRVATLAEIVPGLRWTLNARGPVIVSAKSLAPALWDDELPGRSRGRKTQWSPDRKMALADVVEGVKAKASRKLTSAAALQLVQAEWRRRNGTTPPSLSRLQNLLSEGRALIRDGGRE